MVGMNVTRTLFMFYALIAAAVGALLVISTFFELWMSDGFDVNDMSLALEWWSGLFIVYFICECAARLKFIKKISTQRKRLEICAYAAKHAVGVTVFWALIIVIAILVVSVSFGDDSRWLIIFYAALTL